MNVIIKGSIDVIVVGAVQYVKLFSGTDNGSSYYKKWSTNEEILVDSKFDVNYIQSIEIDFDGTDCLIDEYGSEYYKVTNYIF